ncbi:MAG: Phi19:3 [Ignavibacteria bacterium]|nr:Phi19:3 [Ignavibacteria bacterium]
MEFKEYQHIERFGTAEVQDIELGECYVFPKIDGANTSIWLNEGEVQAASRNRQLTLTDDHEGFYAYILENKKFYDYLFENPSHRLFGEWLIPHSLKTYRKDAWKHFYIFDVCIDKKEDEMLHSGDSPFIYLNYEEYKPLLEKHNLEYIPPLCIIRNGDYQQFINQLMKNVFLLEDGKGFGEGIVIKRYDFRNKYNRQTWAKIVTSEFQEKHIKEMGPAEITGKRIIEEEIAEKYVTTALIDKELAKITIGSDWEKKMIPQLIDNVYYTLVKEECWEFVSEYHNPIIDFNRLRFFAIATIKTKKPELFS